MNHPLKIAYLISRYPAVSHTFILREIQELRKQGMEITPISVNDPDTSAEKQEESQTLYIKRVGVFQAFKTLVGVLLFSPWQFFKTFVHAIRLGGWDLKRIIKHMFYCVEAVIVYLWMKERHIKHVHVHFANPAATVALLVSKLDPTRTYSISMHGPDEFENALSGSLREKIEGALFVVFIGYYAQSQAMRVCAPTEWPKFEVAPLGINTAHFHPSTAKPTQSTLEILCIGRLSASKGQLILLAACSLLIQNRKDIHLTLIGGGPEYATLQQEIVQRNLSPHVSLLGPQNQEQVRQAYEKADIFALPSFAEGIPVVLMEAMAMEIPCVTTFVNGIPELIRDGQEGILTIPSDVNSLYAALQFLIEQPEERTRLGKAGRKRVLEKHQIEQCAKNLKDIFIRYLAHD